MNTRVNELEQAVATALTPFAPALPVASPHAQAMEAHAKAMVQARFVMALQRPRNWDMVRQAVLKECSRPTFAADKSTLYKKPVGRGVEGLGIRFVEMALTMMGNVLVDQHVVYEDEQRRVVNLSVTDLERNVTYPTEITVTKTVERSKPEDDGSYLGVRKNSYGSLVYTVRANDDDLLNKEGALVSKALRTSGLRLIPVDLKEESWDAIVATRTNQAAKDPDAERRRILDGFAQLGVPADQLTEFVGHPLDQCSPAELSELRSVWGAIENEEATWASTIEHRRKERAAQEANGKQQAASPKKADEAAKDGKGKAGQSAPQAASTDSPSSSAPDQQGAAEQATEAPPVVAAASAAAPAAGPATTRRRPAGKPVLCGGVKLFETTSVSHKPGFRFPHLGKQYVVDEITDEHVLVSVVNAEGGRESLNSKAPAPEAPKTPAVASGEAQSAPFTPGEVQQVKQFDVVLAGSGDVIDVYSGPASVGSEIRTSGGHVVRVEEVRKNELIVERAAPPADLLGDA